MHKGDIVIAENPGSKSSRLIRSYGVVHSVTNSGSVVIEMADGSMITRHFSSVAVYTKLPPNWKKLYQQQVVASRPKQRWMPGGVRKKGPE